MGKWDCELKLYLDLWKESISEYIEKYDDETKHVVEDSMKYRRYHSFLVAETAIKLLEENNEILNLDEKSEMDIYKIIYLAALLHDIKKLDDKHGETAAKWIKKRKEKFYMISNNEFKSVYTLIKYHSVTSKKDINLLVEDISDENLTLLLFLKLADKLSKLEEESLYRSINEDERSQVIQKVVTDYNKCTNNKFATCQVPGTD